MNIMLVLSRKLGEKLTIGNDITITVVDIDRGKIRIGIEAPRSIVVSRPDAKKQPEPYQDSMNHLTDM